MLRGLGSKVESGRNQRPDPVGLSWQHGSQGGNFITGASRATMSECRPNEPATRHYDLHGVIPSRLLITGKHCRSCPGSRGLTRDEGRWEICCIKAQAAIKGLQSAWKGKLLFNPVPI